MHSISLTLDSKLMPLLSAESLQGSILGNRSTVIDWSYLGRKAYENFSWDMEPEFKISHPVSSVSNETI